MQINLGYDDIGLENEETIILIGGLATQRTVWPNNFCQSLNNNKFRVIRFDNRDIGESSYFEENKKTNLESLVKKSLMGEKIIPPYTLSDMANDTINLINKLSLDKVHIVGMSMGARIGQVIAKKQSSSIRSLTSIMTTSGAPNLPQGKKEAIDAITQKPKDEFNIDDLIELSIMQQKVIGSPKYPISEDYIQQVVKLNYIRGNNPKGVLRQWLASQCEGDQTDSLLKIKLPVLVIHGKNDPLIPYESGLDVANKITGAKFDLIEGMGHNIPPSLCDLLSKKIINFINQI